MGYKTFNQDFLAKIGENAMDIGNNVMDIGNNAMDIGNNAMDIGNNATWTMVSSYHVHSTIITTVCFVLNLTFPNIFHVYS